MTTVVFLHIPKTAGQTIHDALVPVVGGQDHVSPIRVHTQAGGGAQMPAGYRLYSGHIDWTELETLPQDRFVFSVLRDPRERIASFYMYIRREAETLSPEALQRRENTGKRNALAWSVDDYFFGGDKAWQKYVHNYYNNFYCSYFASRRMSGRSFIEDLSPQDLEAQAYAGLMQMDGLYSTDNLAPLETDIAKYTGKKISVTQRFQNANTHARGASRWSLLGDLLEKDTSLARLESYAERDEKLLRRLNLP